MVLDEAIKHCEDVAEDRCGCTEDCVEEHRQLAEWLKELKELRAKDKPQTFTADGIVFMKMDESQTDCQWK